MSEQEKASLLLERAGRVLSGGELETLEVIAKGEHLLTADELDYLRFYDAERPELEGWRDEDAKDQFTRLCTEFAAYLA